MAICNIYDELLNNVDEGNYSCCIFLDLSKVFDSVQHDILLCKLEKLNGFRGNALELLKSFLTNRVQYTKIGNSKSKPLKVDCGVPQGSSLGPLLFILYANDLSKVSEFSTTLFADDTHLALSDKSLVSLETKVNTQLQNIDIWLRRNKLSLNYSKTTYLLCNKHPYQSIKTKFTVVMNENVLGRNDFVKYLGVYIDKKMTWSVHNNKLSLQLAKHNTMLHQIRDYVTQGWKYRLVFDNRYFILCFSAIDYRRCFAFDFFIDYRLFCAFCLHVID